MEKTLSEQAFWIGYDEAAKRGTLIAPCVSEEMMEFVKKHSMGIGDSIPWFKAFNEGQARWFREETRQMLEQ